MPETSKTNRGIPEKPRSEIERYMLPQERAASAAADSGGAQALIELGRTLGAIESSFSAPVTNMPPAIPPVPGAVPPPSFLGIPPIANVSPSQSSLQRPERMAAAPGTSMSPYEVTSIRAEGLLPPGVESMTLRQRTESSNPLFEPNPFDALRNALPPLPDVPSNAGSAPGLLTTLLTGIMASVGAGKGGDPRLALGPYGTLPSAFRKAENDPMAQYDAELARAKFLSEVAMAEAKWKSDMLMNKAMGEREIALEKTKAKTKATRSGSAKPNYLSTTDIERVFGETHDTIQQIREHLVDATSDHSKLDALAMRRALVTLDAQVKQAFNEAKWTKNPAFLEAANDMLRQAKELAASADREYGQEISLDIALKDTPLLPIPVEPEPAPSARYENTENTTRGPVRSNMGRR